MINKELLSKYTPQQRLDTYLRNMPRAFIAKTFNTVEPVPYTHNWHIDLISEYLVAVQKKQLKRVIFNIPPGYTKSVSINVGFSAWCLGKNPKERIISTSHTDRLSLRMSNKAKSVIESDWYGRIFPETRIIKEVQNTQSFFTTTEGGFRLASSVNASITGDGGELIIVDDPIDAKKANAASGVAIQEVNDWFDGTLYNRLRDKKEGRIVIIMQRLHENDLTGYLMNGVLDKYEHCIIPAVEDEPGGKLYTFGKFKKFREEGELLCPTIEGKPEIDKMKERYGSYGFAAQYQQRPAPKGGGMVKIEWFKRYHNIPQESEIRMIVQSWDTAIKAGQLNDPSCCTTWAETDTGYYLLDVLVEKLEYPELKKRVLSHAEKWKPKALLIEDKASGQSLLQDLRREGKLPAIAINPTADKETRLSSETAKIEAGKVWLPVKASWLNDYERELMLFPNATHDDQVDSTSQFLAWIDSKRSQVRIRTA